MILRQRQRKRWIHTEEARQCWVFRAYAGRRMIRKRVGHCFMPFCGILRLVLSCSRRKIGYLLKNAETGAARLVCTARFFRDGVVKEEHASRSRTVFVRKDVSFWVPWIFHCSDISILNIVFVYCLFLYSERASVSWIGGKTVMKSQRICHRCFICSCLDFGEEMNIFSEIIMSWLVSETFFSEKQA